MTIIHNIEAVAHHCTLIRNCKPRAPAACDPASLESWHPLHDVKMSITNKQLMAVPMPAINAAICNLGAADAANNTRSSLKTFIPTTALTFTHSLRVPTDESSQRLPQVMRLSVGNHDNLVPMTISPIYCLGNFFAPARLYLGPANRTKPHITTRQQIMIGSMTRGPRANNAHRVPVFNSPATTSHTTKIVRELVAPLDR